MSFGGSSKPPEYKAPTTYLGRLGRVESTSPFADSRTAFLNIPGAKAKNNIRMVTSSRPTPLLKEGINLGGNLMNANLGYLNQTPDQRFASITGGNDLYYNVLADQLASAEQKALGRAAVQGQSRGMSNSTTQGAAIANIMDDRLKREREAQLAAFNLGQQTATGNVSTGLGVLSGINNIVTPQAQATAAQLGQLRSVGEQINMQNAQREYESAMARYQADQVNSGWGGSIGSLAGSALGLGLAPFTGGASLKAIPVLSGFGGGIGSIATGGLGSASSGLGNIAGSTAGAIAGLPTSWFSSSAPSSVYAPIGGQLAQPIPTFGGFY